MVGEVTERLNEDVEVFLENFKKLCKKFKGKVGDEVVSDVIFEGDRERWVTCSFDTPMYSSIRATQLPDGWSLWLCFRKGYNDCIELKNLEGVVIKPHFLINRLSVSSLSFAGRDESFIDLDFTEKDRLTKIIMRVPIKKDRKIMIHPITAQYY